METKKATVQMGRRLGIDLWLVLVDGKAKHWFMSEQYANQKAYMINHNRG